jgi:hypothetical protein
MLQEACAAEGVGARQADGLVEGLEADGALWHCRSRSVCISAGGEAGYACSSSTAAEAGHGSWIAGTPLIAREPFGNSARGTSDREAAERCCVYSLFLFTAFA